MKYVVILGDGMADEPLEQLGFKTPLEVANKPTIDRLSMKGQLGLVSTIPKGMSPGSDTANLSVMGYNPEKYYTGRSPLEAISMNISMKDTDISFRCNVVTLSDEGDYDEKIILDHSADEITSEEAKELIATIEQNFGTEILHFYPGVSYRHALIWEGGSTQVDLTPPHDILDKRIGDYLPKGNGAKEIYQMMKSSYDLLANHPVNLSRKERGLNPANSIWIWGEGKKPMLPSFEGKYGLKGTMISAVDLLKGIAIAAKMESIDIVGATGNLNTNYNGKAGACIDALNRGQDFVYLHVEAPDECGHRGELENKIKSIEYLDDKIVRPIVEALERIGYDFRILILPDHPTPIARRTHTSDPVPYILYDSSSNENSGLTYTEQNGALSGIHCIEGHLLMDYLLEKRSKVN
ncbi:MAG: cofactor-independent phosphoglycerate mutase [Firmicutes bacterium HGW-Firmicutes-1]|jgi:2,3-bisphosphoglycerate-independent phosphoglycerate mutase|nr:MAG: cofactor-independent phosphoglycerate mutase [Firmicutes bacterium HGW-Firmicutes-1]